MNRTKRYLIVNADEFGRTDGVNRGTIVAHEHGIVTSASLMVRWPAAEGAAAYARRNPELSVGLHVDLSEWHFLDGSWVQTYEVVPTGDQRSVAGELARQLDAFRALVRREPTHLDSYQNVQKAPAVELVLREAAYELGVPLRRHSPLIHHDARFYGQTAIGESYPELVSAWTLEQLVRTLGPGITELGCHPGFRTDQDGWDSRYHAERALEVAALCDPRIPGVLEDEAVELRSFAQVLAELEQRELLPGQSLRERGVAAFMAGDFDHAEALFRQSVERCPRAAWSWLWLARAKQRRGDVPGCVAALARALTEEHEPQVEPDPVTDVAQVYLELGDPMSAWKAIGSTERLVSRDVLFRIGSALRQAGYVHAAALPLERAVHQDPGDGSALRQFEAYRSEAVVLGGSWRGPRVRRGLLYRPRRTRLLHLVSHSLPHLQVGYTLRTHQVARAQRAVGLEPLVVTRLGFPWDQGVIRADEVDVVEGIRYHRLPTEGRPPPRLDDRLSLTVERASELVRRFRPAVLHAASDFRNALVAVALGEAFDIPVVYEVRGFWEETRLLAQGEGAETRECYRWHRERELACALAADRVVTLSQVMKEELIARGVPADKIAVVPNGVDPDRFRPTSRDPGLARDLGIENGERTLGYVTTLTRYEGLETLLEAVAELARRGRSVRALIVGDGDEREALKSRAAELGLNGRIYLTGRVPHGDVPRYYGLIDIFVVPRTNDRVCQLVAPLKPFEAMAMGKAMVVSAVPPLQEIVQEGVTGVVFPPNDGQALADTVEPLLDDPDRIDALGRAARDWVRANRTWAQNGERYLELYRALGAA